MKISDLIDCLKIVQGKYGEDINVCVYNYCHEMPCETILPEFHDNDFYVNFCEDDVEVGDFILLS